MNAETTHKEYEMTLRNWHHCSLKEFIRAFNSR